MSELPAVVEHEAGLTADLVNRFENASAGDGVPTWRHMRAALARRALRISKTKARAARALGIDRRTFYRWLKAEKLL